MPKSLYLLFALFGLSSCATTSTLQPRIQDLRDPFTGKRTRSMFVGRSDNALMWDALSAYSASPYRLRPATPPVNPLYENNLLTLSVQDGDTMMAFVRINPEKSYDVPADSKMQLLLKTGYESGGQVVNMHVVRAYHTTQGPLIVLGRVEKEVARAILQKRIDQVRIDQVSTNESDLLPVDWHLTTAFSEAFLKGVGKLFEVEPPAVAPAPPKPKKVKKPRKVYYYK